MRVGLQLTGTAEVTTRNGRSAWLSLPQSTYKWRHVPLRSLPLSPPFSCILPFPVPPFRIPPLRCFLFFQIYLSIYLLFLCFYHSFVPQAFSSSSFIFTIFSSYFVDLAVFHSRLKISRRSLLPEFGYLEHLSWQIIF